MNLPLLPTTTIGSFPQTRELKNNRSKIKKGEITAEQYKANLRSMITDCISLQEKLGFLNIILYFLVAAAKFISHFSKSKVVK